MISTGIIMLLYNLFYSILVFFACFACKKASLPTTTTLLQTHRYVIIVILWVKIFIIAPLPLLKQNLEGSVFTGI